MKFLTLAVLLVAPGLSMAELSFKDFEALMKDIAAPSNATWRSIPWKTSLLDAQRVAARERKPLFIWAMDGHPLGCT
jgi:hypothetical protein